MQARIKPGLPFTSLNAFAQVFVKTEWRDVREGVIAQRLANNPFLEYREKPEEKAVEQTAVAEDKPKAGRPKK